MPTHTAPPSGANSDIDSPNAAASDSKKRKAPASRSSTAKKTATAKRKTNNGKAGNNSENGNGVQDDGAQLDRDDSLDVEDEEDDDEDDDGASKTAGGASGKQKPTNRKAQNRNAQRESRQRKAEYVKALEGYVALHKIDLSSQLQGVLFAIGLLIDENMKLRSTLGALSTLFADPTQGSRLPEVGIDIHRLKEAVERNDKNYLLEVGEVLRDKIGMHTREAHATKNVNQARDKQSDEVVVKAPTPNPALNERIAAKASGIDREAVEAPIFGNLTARAENELFDKIRLSGQNFESGGLGMLTTSGSPPKGAGQTLQAHPTDTGHGPEASASKHQTQMEELFQTFEATNKRDEGGSYSADPSNHGAQGSSTGTPVDFNEYLHSNILNSGGSGDLNNMDFNQFLFPSGPSPPSFQMPDFTNLGMHLSPYNSTHANAQYPTNTFNTTPSSFLQPHLQHTAPSPAFGLPSGASSFLKESPSEGNTHSTGLSNFTPLSSVDPPGTSSNQLNSLKATSKTLHKQAKQLIKFHLRSKQEDDTHELPVALEPTTAQGVMPHDPRIDAVLWPAMRDRLIFGNGKIDLQAVLQSLESGEAVIVHATGDLMDPAAWELSEVFVHAYPGLLDGEILKACNKWRSARGESQIAL